MEAIALVLVGRCWVKCGIWRLGVGRLGLGLGLDFGMAYRRLWTGCGCFDGGGRECLKVEGGRADKYARGVLSLTKPGLEFHRIRYPLSAAAAARVGRQGTLPQ
jgi:hypothetical protein